MNLPAELVAFGTGLEKDPELVKSEVVTRDTVLSSESNVSDEYLYQEIRRKRKDIEELGGEIGFIPGEEAHPLFTDITFEVVGVPHGPLRNIILFEERKNGELDKRLDWNNFSPKPSDKYLIQKEPDEPIDLEKARKKTIQLMRAVINESIGRVFTSPDKLIEFLKFYADHHYDESKESF